jgi:hypothetical protein
MSWAAYKRRRDRRRLRIFEAPPDGTVGVAYSWAPTISGGLAPYTLTNIGGALPAGLTITTATLSGTPSAAGTYALIWRITDANGLKTEQGVEIVIRSA